MLSSRFFRRIFAFADWIVEMRSYSKNCTVHVSSNYIKESISHLEVKKKSFQTTKMLLIIKTWNDFYFHLIFRLFAFILAIISWNKNNDENIAMMFFSILNQNLDFKNVFFWCIFTKFNSYNYTRKKNFCLEIQSFVQMLAQKIIIF